MSAITTWCVRMPKNVETWRAMVLTAIEPVGRVKRYDDGRGDDGVFQDQIIKPVALERRIGAFHDIAPLASLAASALVIVVLASH